MEKKSFESLYGGGGEISGGFPSYEAMFSGVSLQSVLTMNPPIFAHFASALPHSSYLTFQNDELPPLPTLLNHRELDASLNYHLMDHHRLNQNAFHVPKLEPLLFLSQGAVSTELSTEQSYDFSPIAFESGYYNDSFARLPELSSLEVPMVLDSLTHYHLPSSRRVACNTQTQMVDYSMLVQQNFQSSMLNLRTSNNSSGADLFSQVQPSGNCRKRFSSSPLQKKASPTKKKLPAVASVVHRSILTRQRSQKLSEKTRCLQKLLPWDKKMDMATMLGETSKYVKFLQAQLCALKSMPRDSGSAIADRDYDRNGGPFGGLEKLNRNQVLQVLVNSPVAQTLLYSKKCCVFSTEQISLIWNMYEKSFPRQTVIFDTSTTGVNFF